MTPEKKNEVTEIANRATLALAPQNHLLARGVFEPRISELGTPLGQSPEFDLAGMREVHKLSRARQGVVFPSRGEDGETSSSGSDVG